MSVVIEIQELFKFYGESRAVGPLSATIERGEIIGLLGLNGAGKTTTLRILACDLLPSGGSVKVDGIDVVERPDEVRARIGYLPDTPPLYGEMTVREYLRFAARLRGVKRAELDARVDEAARQTAVGAVLDQVIDTLSHGFKQRVGIAQAIVHKPSLVVLDEPISGLDPVQIIEMRELVRSLGGEYTVIVSSHILSEISETCDRLFVIRDGEIVAKGTEAELSRGLLQGMALEVGVTDAARALDVLRGVEGVRDVEEIAAIEPGMATVSLATDGDRRAAVVGALVAGGVGVLHVGRAARELESVFIQLAASPEAAELRKKRRKKRPDEEVVS